MPKLKTHKGAQSRFHITARGKMMRLKIGKSHFRIRKTKRTKRLFDEKVGTSPSDKKRIQRVLPYGF